MSKRRNETHEEYLGRRRQKILHPEQKAKARDRARLFRLQNPEKIKSWNKINYAKNPGVRGKLKKIYGITPVQYDEMLARQNGLCASCGGVQRLGRPLCVDHCHRTKAVRGLICDACNICAGHIKSQRFRKVLAYLARQEVVGDAS